MTESFVRPSWDETFLQMAEVIGRRSTCPRAFKLCPDGIGAVLVERDGRLALGFGYCGVRSCEPHCLDVGCQIGEGGGCVATVHAEVNAIRHARPFDGPKALYTTVSPCERCLREACHAGVVEIAFRHKYRIFEPVEALAAALGVKLAYVPGSER